MYIVWYSEVELQQLPALCWGEARRRGRNDSPEGGGGDPPGGRAGGHTRAVPARLPRAKPTWSWNAQIDVQELLAVHILFLIIIIIVL